MQVRVGVGILQHIATAKQCHIAQSRALLAGPWSKFVLPLNVQAPKSKTRNGFGKFRSFWIGGCLVCPSFLTPFLFTRHSKHSRHKMDLWWPLCIAFHHQHHCPLHNAQHLGCEVQDGELRKGKADQKRVELAHPKKHRNTETLWWTNIAIDNGHRNSGFSH